MTRNLTMMIIGGLTFVFVFISIVYWSSDNKFKRSHVNKHLMELRDRLRKDPDDKQAVAGLIAALDDSYPFAKRSAASFLGQVGPAAKKAVPALALALKSKDPYLSRAAAISLRNMGPDAREAVPNLIEALKLGNDDTAWFSAEALGNIGSEAEAAIPALVECLDVHSLTQVYGDPGPQLAFEAADALAKFGPQAREAIPSLKKKLETPNPDFKLHLSFAIRSIDPDDSESLEILMGFIGDNKMNNDALRALGKLGVNAKSAIPKVEAYMRRELSSSDRQHAAFTLQKLEGK